MSNNVRHDKRLVYCRRGLLCVRDLCDTIFAIVKTKQKIPIENRRQKNCQQFPVEHKLQHPFLAAGKNA